MNSLLIDTSNEIELISVMGNGRGADVVEVVKRSHSSSLFRNIDSALKKSSLTINDIQLIGAGIGPGSFTGIRITVATARMLAQLLKVPLVGIKTQLIYASSLSTADGDNILVAFDAKKKRVFGALYKRGINNRVNIEIVPPGDYSIDFLVEKTDERHKTYLLGNGTVKYMGNIKEKLSNVIFDEDFLPSGKEALSIIEEEYINKPDVYTNIRNTVPFYARKSDAETG